MNSFSLHFIERSADKTLFLWSSSLHSPYSVLSLVISKQWANVLQTRHRKFLTAVAKCAYISSQKATKP